MSWSGSAAGRAPTAVLGDETVRIETPAGFQTGLRPGVDQAVHRLTSTGGERPFLTMPPQATADDVAQPAAETQARSP